MSECAEGKINKWIETATAVPKLFDVGFVQVYLPFHYSSVDRLEKDDPKVY